MRLTHIGGYAHLVVRIDDLFTRVVPDKVVAKPYVDRVGLYKVGIVRIDFDMAPGMRSRSCQSTRIIGVPDWW